MSDMQTLQVLEKQYQSVVQQRQHYQRQVLECENALEELQSGEDAYQIVGSVMVKKSAKDISSDLQQKKEVASVRLEKLSTQETQLRAQVEELQKKVISDIDQG